jgi:PAS domain S-box-containing protein
MSAGGHLEMDLSGYSVATLLQDGQFVLCRGTALTTQTPYPQSILISLLAAEHPLPAHVRMLEHEVALRHELDAGWALRPLGLVQHQGRVASILEDQHAEPLATLIGGVGISSDPDARRDDASPIELHFFLKMAVGLAAAVGEMHRRGLIHKNIKPANILVNQATGHVWLTGFGIASRLPRERQAPEPPETMEGTLAYMAPEQTGRMNRSIDARSDLYAVGVTLYQMLTGSLPFSAEEPIEWVHCHIARQPTAPDKRVANVPAPVSAVVMKLLAKAAEDRYQTAAGLERDLRHCLAEWQTKRWIDTFPVGHHDTPDQLLIPEKLYGRAREVETLLAAFDRVVQSGAPELVLVSGYSGIGKSSVVNELHKALVPPRALFAAGKFDQHKRDIPYSTLAQVFQRLIRPLLSKSENELGRWRVALREALGSNGQLMVDLVPDLKIIVGEQSAVPELSPQDTQRRFQLVFRRFLGVFARPEHPLALFLDDLQWLDAATLDLLEDLMIQSDVRHVLLIGAYRDNEVPRGHTLKARLDAIRSAGATPVLEIVLAPLGWEDVCRLIEDSLHCNAVRAAPLAQLVHEKSAGNPFFAIQFLSTLIDEGLVHFDHAKTQWRWDLARIHEKGYTDNVIELMIGKLRRLPTDTQHALRYLACLGNSVDATVLAMVYKDSRDEVDRDLQRAEQSGLVFRSGGTYRFLHDRVQEAAYSLIPDGQRTEIHLRIGRLLVAHTPLDKREDVIFEIINQLNRGATLITSRSEQDQLAEFNLIAGTRAKASTAYESAQRYLAVGMELLGDDGWDHRPDLMFELELRRAECEFLIGELDAAEVRLTRLSSRAVGVCDRAAVACLRVDLYAVLGRQDRAVAVCLEYLQQVGVEWSAHPTNEDVTREYEKIWQRIGSRPIDDLIDLPLMGDADTQATMDVLMKVMPSAQCTDEKLLCMVITGMVNLSLEYGNSNASCCGYVWLGLLLSSHFDNYPTARRFGQLSLDLVERRGLNAFKARVYEAYGIFVSPWVEHVRHGRAFVQRAFNEANRIGDLTYVSYCYNNFVTSSLACGERLADVEREATEGLHFAQEADFGLVCDILRGQLCLVLMLRGLTRNLTSFNDAEFDERTFEEHLEADSNLAIAACWYFIRKVQARVFAQDYASALEAAAKAEALLWTSPAFFEQAEYHFYSALAHAGSVDSAHAVRTNPQSAHVEALARHYRKIHSWAENCPENFESRALLIGAEIARLEGRELEAERLYEAAVHSAHKNEFVQNEALANELAARFHAARGFARIAMTYMRDARDCYVRWGADGKVRQLEAQHAFLADRQLHPDRNGTVHTSVDQLDLATALKVSQAVSGETDLERLTATVMRLGLEHAGAERGLLILPHGDAFRIEAEAMVHDHEVTVDLRRTGIGAHDLPRSVLQCVLRTREPVALQDASAAHEFRDDEYVRSHQARSVLCLPLLKQTRLVAILYLENNLIYGAFTPARMALVAVLAADAAISLENAQLYRELQEREARVRRLIDSNIIGIFIWHEDGRVLDSNDAFLQMIGYQREEIVSGRVRWPSFTSPEWQHRIPGALQETREAGAAEAREWEYVKKDGTHLPVLLGSAIFDEAPEEGVCFVLELTAVKRAEQAVHDGERRYLELQLRLAEANRIASVGEFSASIAHEINQPLSGVITNASTCLRLLAADPPNVELAAETAKRALRDGNRVTDVITRLRALFAKGDLVAKPVDLNEAVREVLALASNELQREHVILRSELADDRWIVSGDQVQLQQVILNLLRNAVDAMRNVHDRPRELEIRTERDGISRVLLSVRDSGVGLEPQDTHRLFEAFYTTKKTGMGIGLSVSRSIIESHGGRLWAAPNDGPGATFSFSMPVA